MLITRISKRKSGRGRYSVYVDGSPAFEVSETVLVKTGLRANESIDEQQLASVKAAETDNEARTIAVNYLSYRPRSANEVIQHLVRKGIPRETAEPLVRHFESIGLINNLEFARMFVRDRLRRKPTGRALVRNLLGSKGISPAVIDRVLKETITDEDQTTAARELAARRLRLTKRSMAGLDLRKQQQRITGYLLRHGFSSEIVQRTIRSLFRP
ncbi:MAG TPA: RecX family transcriptional regulator [Bacteroidota bacterium]|nr:RecX family transcriptional regulator [Bacteroidota bacterium]